MLTVLLLVLFCSLSALAWPTQCTFILSFFVLFSVTHFSPMSHIELLLSFFSFFFSFVRANVTAYPAHLLHYSIRLLSLRLHLLWCKKALILVSRPYFYRVHKQHTDYLASCSLWLAFLGHFLGAKKCENGEQNLFLVLLRPLLSWFFQCQTKRQLSEMRGKVSELKEKFFFFFLLLLLKVAGKACNFLLATNLFTALLISKRSRSELTAAILCSSTRPSLPCCLD